jgi:hypothetical protein
MNALYMTMVMIGVSLQDSLQHSLDSGNIIDLLAIELFDSHGGRSAGHAA